MPLISKRKKNQTNKKMLKKDDSVRPKTLLSLSLSPNLVLIQAFLYQN